MCDTLCALISQYTTVVTQLFTTAILFFLDTCDSSCRNGLIISGLVIACVAMIFIAAVVLFLGCHNRSEALLNFNCHALTHRRGKLTSVMNMYFRISLQISNGPGSHLCLQECLPHLVPAT